MDIHMIKELLKVAAEKANRKEWEDAEIDFRNVLAEDEKQPVALAGLGGVLYLTGRYEEAGQILKVALAQVAVLPQSYFYWAKLCLHRKRWEQAAQAILQSIEIAPDVSEQYQILGEAYWQQKKWSEAACAYCFFLQKKHNDVQSWERLAECWSKLDMKTAALEVWRQILTIDPFLELPKEKVRMLLESCTLSLSYEKMAELNERYITIDTEKYQHIKLWQQASELLENGQIREGLEQLAKYAQCAGYDAFEGSFWWNGEMFSGKRLLIYDDEIIVDAATFFRYIPLVKNRGGIVILAVRETWLEIAASIVGSDYVVSLKDVTCLENISLKVSILALPMIFGITRRTVCKPKKLCKQLEMNFEKTKSGCRKIVVACSPIIVSCLEKVKKNQQSYSWSTMESGREISFFQRIKNALKSDLLISDDRALCHWVGLCGMPFLYLSTMADDSTWWKQDFWYEGSTVVKQIVPGDWFGMEREINGFLRRQEIEEDDS